jgi:hypothetical protein
LDEDLRIKDIDVNMTRILITKKAIPIMIGTAFSAPQVGLEPTTYGLTVRRSNQLSY